MTETPSDTNDRDSFGYKLTETRSDAKQTETPSDATRQRTPSDANSTGNTFGCKFDRKHLRMQFDRRHLRVQIQHKTPSDANRQKLSQESPSGAIFQTQQKTLQLRLGQENGSNFSFGFQ